MASSSRSEGKQFTITVYDMPTCKDWLSQWEEAKKVDSDQSGLMRSREWAYGFLASYGFYNNNHRNILSHVDRKTIDDWLYFYCNSTPNQDVVNALDALIVKLNSRKND
jgi:hypothetical protein